MTDRCTAYPVRGEICQSPPGVGAAGVHVFYIFFYVIWIIDCVRKWQEFCTHITHVHMARAARPDLLTHQRLRMMDTHVGPIVDIHAQLIIHELHCAWISLFSPRLTEEAERRGAPSRYLTFTLWRHVCVFKMVSDTHGRWFIFTVYICAMQVMVSDVCWIIEIHGAVAAELSIGERGREWGTWDGERQGQSRDSAVVSVISYLERQTLGTPLQ